MSSKPPVVFVDYCCSQVEPVNTYLNVDLKAYQVITVMPNVMVDRDGNRVALKEFQHWCLDHLLKRKPQSPVTTDDGSMVGHWLNPETVDNGRPNMSKFIGIHNDKVSALLGSDAVLTPTHLSAIQANEYVTPGAIAYQKMLDDAGMTLGYQVKSIMDIAYPPPAPAPAPSPLPAPSVPLVASAGGAAVPTVPMVPTVYTSSIPTRPSNMSHNRNKRWDKYVGLYGKSNEQKFLDVLIEMAREESALLASVAPVAPEAHVVQEAEVPNPFTGLVSRAMAFIPKFL